MKIDIHQWVNSAGVILSLAIASSAAYFSYVSTKMKDEDLKIFVRSTNDCKLNVVSIGDRSLLGVCWDVIVSNRSELKLSLVGIDVSEIGKNGGISKFGGPSVVQSDFDFPSLIDQGDTSRSTVYTYTTVNSVVASYARELIKNKAAASLQDLTQYLMEKELSILGDKVEVYRIDGRATGFSMEAHDTNSRKWLIEFSSGRGMKFSTVVYWPPKFTQ